jgi:hypothetical protein
MRGLVIGAATAMAIALGATGVGAQQIQLDRTLQRVYDQAIMTSDVREARLLRLVPDTSSDDTVQRALENRLLILHEMARSQPVDPGRDAVAARRRTWTSAWPAGTDVAAIMTKCGTTEQALDSWFRTDLELESFLTGRFGQPGDPARDQKIADWIADLRKRANLR